MTPDSGTGAASRPDASGTRRDTVRDPAEAEGPRTRGGRRSPLTRVRDWVSAVAPPPAFAGAGGGTYLVREARRSGGSGTPESRPRKGTSRSGTPRNGTGGTSGGGSGGVSARVPERQRQRTQQQRNQPQKKQQPKPSAAAPASRPSPRGSVRRPPRPSGSVRPSGAARGLPALRARVMRAWDRPLTAYYLILGGSLLLTVLGLVMVFSASQIEALQSGLPSTYYFRKQLIAALVGAVLLLAASRMPVRLHRKAARPLLGVSVVLMCLVQVPGLGQEVNGNRNWIHFGGPFQLQPSEFAKLALVLWGADLLANKRSRRLLTQWKQLLVPLVPVGLLLLGLIMLGGDMGTAIIVTTVVFGLLWLAGAPTRLFATVLAVAGVLSAVLILTSPNRMARLSCIGATDPGANDQCWQAVHGIYALASGGWFGSGLGASMEKWGQLPEPHTDFIFAVTGEELGLAGTLSVLALFAALGYAGIRVAGRTEEPFVRYAAGGVTTWITAQAVVNIGAVLGLLPIAGVPLPLFSYGGSALLPTMFAIGLLIAFARSDPAAGAALAMRQPALRQRLRKRLAGVRTNTMRRRADRPPSGER
jgi:cell division protein FtsW